MVSCSLKSLTLFTAHRYFENYTLKRILDEVCIKKIGERKIVKICNQKKPVDKDRINVMKTACFALPDWGKV
jgi:hypothetical protein